MLALVFGAVGGFIYSKIRLHQREVELGEATQRLRERRVELQREAYQTSISSFHKKSDQEKEPDSALEELLKQRDHELSILEQESQLEIRILREQNEMLQEELNELKTASYPYGLHVEPGLFEDVLDRQDVDVAEVTDVVEAAEMAEVVEAAESDEDVEFA